jgi:hypothetical protein
LGAAGGADCTALNKTLPGSPIDAACSDTAGLLSAAVVQLFDPEAEEAL